LGDIVGTTNIYTFDVSSLIDILIPHSTMRNKRERGCPCLILILDLKNEEATPLIMILKENELIQVIPK
jgi:hypothetical protein